MKKLLIFALSLMAFASTARAQGHWTFDEGAYDMSTVVYTDLVVDGSALYDRAAIGDYEVAAFVGDEVRAKMPTAITASRTMVPPSRPSVPASTACRCG